MKPPAVDTTRSKSILRISWGNENEILILLTTLQVQHKWYFVVVALQLQVLTGPLIASLIKCRHYNDSFETLRPSVLAFLPFHTIW